MTEQLSLHFSYFTPQQGTISWSDCDMQRKMDFRQLVTTSLVVGSRCSKSTSQSQICTKTRPWSLFGGLLLVWPTTAFWTPAKPLYLRSMLSKSIRCTQHCMPAARTGQQNGPNSSPRQRLTACCTNNASELEETGLQNSASSAIFTWALTNWCFFKHLNNFLQGWRFHNQQEAQYFPRVRQILSKSSPNPKAWIFMIQE